MYGYDPGIVFLSYLIAALAGYVTLEMAGRVRAHRRSQGWLSFGAVVMGTGIWSMHFIGMAAMQTPFALRYDLLMTAVSWLAACSAAALALWLVRRKVLSTPALAGGALAMGAAICVMHYLGMAALRMSVAIQYDVAIVLLSVVIAIGASAAALWIATRLKPAESWRDIGVRIAAAAVMGLAIAGMHYTGMWAANFAPDAVPAADNLLGGQGMVRLTAIGAFLMLGLALWSSIQNARQIMAARREAAAAAARVRDLAFYDQQTRLPNRANFTQTLIRQMHRKNDARFSVATLRLVNAATGQDAANVDSDTARRLAALLTRSFPKQTVGRPADNLFALLLTERDAANAARIHGPALAVIQKDFGEGYPFQLQVGFAAYPDDGDTGQMLLFKANGRAVTSPQPAQRIA